MIAFTLNPLVRDLTRFKVPRALSVLIVYMIFTAAVAALLVAIGVVAFDQARIEVVPAAGREPDQDPDGFIRVASEKCEIASSLFP